MRQGSAVVRRIGICMLLCACALVTAVAGADDLEGQARPVTFRELLIIKRVTDVASTPHGPSQQRLSDKDVEAITRTFSVYVPTAIMKLSHGRVRWLTEVVVSDRPIKKVSPVPGGYWLSPQDVDEDIDQNVVRGQYDGVFTYWKGQENGKGIPCGGGHASVEARRLLGYSCCTWQPLFRWKPEHTEMWIHEWIHQCDGFYGARGVPLPQGHLHGDKNYKHGNWYEEYINGTVDGGNGVHLGLGENAWKVGPMRQHQGLSVHRPEWRAAEREAANLLKNASFEADGGWELGSWRKTPDAAGMVGGTLHTGKRSLMLQAKEGDDAHALQTVSVVPHANYLLSGWIKTKDVKIVQENGTMGACLSIDGTREVSDPVYGTAYWTYVYLVFNARDRKEIKVGPRLGHWESLAAGQAWFDDLCLVRL